MGGRKVASVSINILIREGSCFGGEAHVLPAVCPKFRLAFPTKGSRSDGKCQERARDPGVPLLEE